MNHDLILLYKVVLNDGWWAAVRKRSVDRYWVAVGYQFETLSRMLELTSRE